MPRDLHHFSAVELGDAFASGLASPVAALEASLQRIGATDPLLNAFRLVDSARAREAARAAEARWLRGAPLSPLDGVPVAIKDVFLTAGWPTLRGSRAVDPDQAWDEDAPAVAALRRAGAVLVGKTTTPEIGWKGVTDSPLDGVTRNPWDPSRTAGGSSGGSSAALAAGMVPLALGTDGGGSIRIPSAFCGLPGLKPTFGRVPAWPASPFGVLAHAGPMARTVADLVLLMDVLVAPDVRDWTALPPWPGSFAVEDGVRGLRIGFSPDLGYADVHPEVAALVAAAAARFAELGAHVEPVAPLFPDPRGAYETMWSAGAAKAVAGLGSPPPDELLDPGCLVMVERGRALSAVDYLGALAERDALGLAMSRFHEEWDLLLTPALPIEAFTAGRNVPEGWPDSSWPSWTPFTYPFNLTQQPAGVVPCGFTSGGLPVGLQVVGPRYADDLVLRALAAYERADPQPTIAA
jgi:aspartyl-tRNA(Asn)/glutamyl-tRNA(Gln) amidotransferase subunit A